MNQNNKKNALAVIITVGIMAIIILFGYAFLKYEAFTKIVGFALLAALMFFMRWGIYLNVREKLD